MKVALIYPPTCDPTAPYIALPALTAYLRCHGVDVLQIDANVEAYDLLLRKAPLEKLARRLEERLAELEGRHALSHVEQLAYAVLHGARGEACYIPRAIDDAVAVLRDRSGVRFFNPQQYAAAVEAVEGALYLISAAYTPLSMDFTTYRTPFSLISMDEIKADGRPKKNPFSGYFQKNLCPRLAVEGIDLVGISVAFASQIQPAYALAFILREKLPAVHITVGGPAITQLLSRLEGARLQKAIGPFHSAILFEGEQALLDLIKALGRGRNPKGVIQGAGCTDLSHLPCPDFDGLPLEKYFSPRTVLPYDPTRGCYWGRCAFCHYGLAKTGTAPYRERPVEQVLEHLQELSTRHNCALFYFSEDSLSPKTALKLAKAIEKSGRPWRWSTDMRPEKSLSPLCCAKLKRGGLLSAALGIESASPRVASLINKGILVEDARAAVVNLAEAGVAVEAMFFTDFPTETAPEARATIAFIKELKNYIALFICGCFDLVSGARVALRPHDYGIKEIWHAAGDELRTGLFYEETVESKTGREREKIEDALDRLSRSWWLHHYPWAGALSTAHTQLWFEMYGSSVFKQCAGTLPDRSASRDSLQIREAKFDVPGIARQAAEHEAEIWRILVRELRTVNRRAYQALAAKIPCAKRLATKNKDGRKK